MAIQQGVLEDFRIERIEHVFTRKDAILYALGVGLGGDPLDPVDLAFLFEQDLKVLPSFGGVLGYPGFWIKDHPDLGIEWRLVLNGEQGIVLHKPLPPSGHVVASLRVVDVVDKGAGKDCLVYTVRDVRDAGSGESLCEVANTVVCRGQGGFGGSATARTPVPKVTAPERAADLEVDFRTLPQAGLIYRLSGDLNPLHIDPAVARQAGFERPILHGAATWGIAATVLMKALCSGDPDRFRSYSARFTSPVFPGDLVRTEIWGTGEGSAVFRCSVPERGKRVLDAGSFTYGGDRS